jgi:hypothetical protein
MRLRWTLILAFCCIVAASGAMADKTLHVQRLSDAEVTHQANGGPARQDCQVGNLNLPTYAIADWVWGAEGYKYLFRAPATCSCPVGFRLENVHLLMQFGPEDVPVSFDVYADLEEAVWDDLISCYFPGAELCTSLVYTVQIDAEGMYDISLPIFEQCQCAAMGFWYFLSFHFVSEFSAAGRPDLVADNAPLECHSWNDYGFGWQDLVHDFGWPGEILMYADVACCEIPVAAEPGTWGSVKSLYR